MPGIDRSRVVGKDAEEVEEFVCGICHDVFINPVVTACCRQSYCKDCIEEWLKGHDTCPNDRKRLTRGQLMPSARVVVNVIEKMKIKCVFGEKGCLSVHTIGQDAEHLKLCQYSKCRRCGRESPDSGHNCVNHLLIVNIELNRDRDKLKRKIARVERKNRDLKTSELLVTNENKKLKNDVAALADMNGRLKRELKANRILAVKMAIIKAKGESGRVEEKRKTHKNLVNITIDICNKAIDQFDNTLHSCDHLVEMIKTQLDQQSSIRNKCHSWSVAIFVNRVFGDWSSVGKLVRLSFGNLIIIVSRE